MSSRPSTWVSIMVPLKPLTSLRRRPSKRRREHQGQGADDAAKRRVGPKGAVGQKLVPVLVPGNCIAQAGTRHDARDVDHQDGKNKNTDVAR